LPTIQAVAAEGDYTVLAPLPGTTKGVCNPDATPPDPNCETTLAKYLPGVFKLAIGLSAVFAVLMIVIGGFQYMSTDAIQKKSDGKERIKNAVFGLVLVIGAWLILNEINPNLLNLNLNIEKVTTIAPKGILGGELSAGTGGIFPGYTLTQAQVDTNTAMRNDLKNNYGIDVNAGPCTTGGTSGCTNLVGMTATTFKGVTDLKSVCGCNITISGGTEGGHASHGPNMPPIDLRFDTNLDKYILDNQVSGVAPQTIPGVGIVYTSKVGNRNATFLKEYDHWHVVFE